MAMMRTRTQFLTAAALLVVVALLRSVSAQTLKAPAILQMTADTVLTRQTMQEDLDYLVRILKNVHPATYRGFSKQQQAVIDAAYQQIEAPLAAKEFYFVANTVICSLQDGHTQLGPMKNYSNRRIDVPIVSLHDGFYVVDDREPFAQGDRIVAIGSRDIETIYKRMRVLIPAENEYRRRLCMAQNIQREEFLDHLGVIEDKAVAVRVKRGGAEITLTAPLKHATQCKRPGPKRPWVGYEIHPDLSLGVFHLDQCIPGNSYKITLRSFFESARDQNIRNVAIDVRRNGGGNSQVIDEFFRYLDIKRYRHYGGDVRYSEEVAEKTGYSRTSGYRRGKPQTKRNRRVEDATLLFAGELFVLTSPATFSSGNWFAVVVKDNGLGTVIGEPTGNAPSSYGDVPTFQMPQTGFTFSVSHKKWLRPNRDSDQEDALYPDILVHTTIDDIVKGVDPQLARLKAIISETDT